MSEMPERVWVHPQGIAFGQWKKEQTNTCSMGPLVPESRALAAEQERDAARSRVTLTLDEARSLYTRLAKRAMNIDEMFALDVLATAIRTAEGEQDAH